MSELRIYPARLEGSVVAPPSKSAAHRALICAALSGQACQVAPVAASADMQATLGVLAAMGARFTQDAAAVRFLGAHWTDQPVTLNCIESGSTLRFLLPVAAALGIPATFTGSGRLPQRPIGALTEQLREHHISLCANTLPLTISGRLSGGRFMLPGDSSSQFISGLLFALPMLEQDSEILLTCPLQSAGYVDMTLKALRASGIRVTDEGRGTASERFYIPGKQHYHSGNLTVEGDWSNAAFWLCAAAISGNLVVSGLGSSVQGDRAIMDLIWQFGGQIAVNSCGDVWCYAAPLHGCRIDAGPIPDLVPILAVMGAFANGTTEIYNAARLRIKESDRLATVTAMLRSLGGQVEEYPDRLVIHGGGLRGGQVDGANDHRIVMAAAIAAQNCTEPVVITGTQAVQKSYPSFFSELSTLGGRFDVV